MQFIRLHIICLCAAIQFQLIIGHPRHSQGEQANGQGETEADSVVHNGEHNNGEGEHKFLNSTTHNPDAQQYAQSVTETVSANNEGRNHGNAGQRSIDSSTNGPIFNETSNHGNRKPEQHAGPKPTRHSCTVSTENYDCQIQNVHLKKGQPNNIVFGLERNNTQQKLTFRESTLEYLPKSLIDAFPLVTLLNLNGLRISSIEQRAFEHAADLQAVYLADNRLVRIDEGAFHGANNLQKLVLSNNEIVNFDDSSFDHNTDLRYFYLDRNQLTTLPAFTNTVHLEYLTVSHNNLASIEPRHFGMLRKLKTLDLSFNLLKQLNLQQLNAPLDVVDVSCNDLTEFFLPSNVKRLNAKNNSLTKVTVAEQCNLEILNIAKNRIDTVPKLDACSSLNALDLSNNYLEVFKLSPFMLNLEYLRLRHNKLFEILLPNNPTKMASVSFQLKWLDLSHNKLSYGPSLSEFKKLEWVKLNDNNLISVKSYANHANGHFKHYEMANNEWNCAEVEKFQHWTKDKHVHPCAQDMQNITGICCRVYKKPFNDRLNEILREADFHERSNQKKCPKVETTTSNPMAAFENIRKAIASSDTARGNKLKEIQETTVRKTDLERQFQEIKADRDRVNEYKYKVTQEVEKQRQVHRVPKEGLILDIEMLNRIIKFVQEKDAFTKDLLTRRKVDTEEANRLFADKQRGIQDLKDINTKLQTNLKALKDEENKKKKEIQRLEKKVNKNASAIHGSTGRIM